jgi:hypothetical protein
VPNLFFAHTVVGLYTWGGPPRFYASVLPGGAGGGAGAARPVPTVASPTSAAHPYRRTEPGVSSPDVPVDWL